MDKVFKALFKNIIQDKAAHFFILSDVTQSGNFEKWTYDLLGHIFTHFLKKDVPSTSLINHTDFLAIENPVMDKNYTVDDMEPLFKFMHYKAMELPRKFLVIKNAHLINEKLSNKLLKTLEEPPIDCTIFLLNPNNIKLIPTIESRGIKIRVAPNKQNISNKIDLSLFKKIHEGMAFHELLELCKADKSIEGQLTSALLEVAQNNVLDPVLYNQMIQLLKNQETSKEYNGAQFQRILPLFEIIKIMPHSAY